MKALNLPPGGLKISPERFQSFPRYYSLKATQRRYESKKVAREESQCLLLEKWPKRQREGSPVFKYLRNALGRRDSAVLREPTGRRYHRQKPQEHGLISEGW